MHVTWASPCVEMLHHFAYPALAAAPVEVHL